jgi:hypothetical protein
MFELRRSERVIEMVMVFTNPEGVSLVADESCHPFGIRLILGAKVRIISSLRD